MTILLDAQTYSAQALTELYGYRWRAAEVNLRHVKTTLKVERITAKTPAMVRKEFWAHLLGYNLVCTVMEQAVPIAQAQRARLSFQSARQGFRAILSELGSAQSSVRELLYEDLLYETATVLVPDRPGRREPRVVKQRPKTFPRMQEPRSALKSKLVA